MANTWKWEGCARFNYSKNSDNKSPAERSGRGSSHYCL